MYIYAIRNINNQIINNLWDKFGKNCFDENNNEAYL